MKLLLALLCVCVASSSFASFKTIAQCAVNSVKSSSGARVNLLLTKDNQYKANLILDQLFQEPPIK